MDKKEHYFLWGSATSSYQVEGGNVGADWHEWEQRTGRVPCGSSTDHWHRYEEDFDLLKSLNQNAYRFSIEWSRIFPKPGQVHQESINHYQKMLEALYRRGIEPVVTLHHFTSPTWFMQRGGWTHPQAVEDFLDFVRVMVQALGQRVHWWITFNEPTIYVSHSFWWGIWPPQGHSLVNAWKINDVLKIAHDRAYQVIREIYQEQKWAHPQIGISHHMQAIVLCRNTWLNRLIRFFRQGIANDDWLDHLNKSKTMDFIGLNYYSRQQVDAKWWSFASWISNRCAKNHDPVAVNSLGWDIYPKGLKEVLMRTHARYQQPIMITENGICTDDDDVRAKFIVDHIKSLQEAQKAGVPVLGYFYWSLLDNYEWDKGFKPRFGLIEINYQSGERRIRPSAHVYAACCQQREGLK